MLAYDAELPAARELSRRSTRSFESRLGLEMTYVQRKRGLRDIALIKATDPGSCTGGDIETSDV